MRPNERPLIRSLPLFRDMAESHFDTLIQGASVQNVPPQVQLITEGDPADHLHVLIEGSVELFANWDGHETIVLTLRHVSAFIVAATVRNAPYLMSARTLEKARLVRLPSADVRAVFDLDAAFARAVVAELALGYRMVIKHTKDLKLRTSVERLANYLLRQYNDLGTPEAFDLGIGKRKLASYLGMTPENLSRGLKALQQHGVLIEASIIRIADPAALIAFAKPTPLIDNPFA